MTTFSITPNATPDPTGFAVIPTVGGVTLKWTEPTDEASYGAEIWVNTTNTLATATLIAIVTGSSFYYEMAANTTKYFWIRGRDVYGRATGNWLPSSGSGAAGSTPGASTADIQLGAVNTYTVTSKTVNSETNTAAFPMFSYSSSSAPASNTQPMLWKVFTPTTAGSTMIITFADNVTYSLPPLTTDNGFDGYLAAEGNSCGLTFLVQIRSVTNINDPTTDTLIAEWGAASSSNIFEWKRVNGAIVPMYLESQPSVLLSPYKGSGPVLVPGNLYRAVLTVYTFKSSGCRAPSFTSSAPSIIVQELKR